jgi:hypothetical protein
MKKFRFKFFDGQVFFGYGAIPRDALVSLGLGAYNPVAYDVDEPNNEPGHSLDRLPKSAFVRGS